MPDNKNKAAQAMGMLSAAARLKKYGKKGFRKVMQELAKKSRKARIKNGVLYRNTGKEKYE